ncbi:hypothetical protein JCM8115_003111 [Rhodotorula mucilaginosa]
MGLAYFVSTCPAQPPTLQGAQIWCVTQEGVCCGICGNTLASLGSRVGLSATVFFSTAVTVLDGAESPFKFLTACVQAVAYLVAILLHGFGGTPLSRFHAYYALVAALGFLCPLAASAVTAPHYNHGGSHEPGKRLKRYGSDIGRQRNGERRASAAMSESRTHVERSLGPFSPSRDGDYAHVRRFRSQQRRAKEDSAERRPLASTRVWEPTHGSSSIESTPALLPTQEGMPREWPLEEGTDAKNSPLGLRPRQSGLGPLSRATPASLLAAGEPLFTTPPDPSPSARSRRYNDQQSGSVHHQDSALLDPIQLPSPSIRPIVIRPGRPRSSSCLSDDTAMPDKSVRSHRESHKGRGGSIGSTGTTYSERSRQRIAWRRYGMINANATLFAAWLATYLLVRGSFGNAYRLGQADCPDPSGTVLLAAAQTAGIIASFIVGLICWANFYSHHLHIQLRRVFDYSRGGLLWTRALVPAIFSGVIYCTWLTLLWTAYELSTTPSLRYCTRRYVYALHRFQSFEPKAYFCAMQEELPTFASSLALALAVRPACDLLKAIWRYLRRRRQHRKL